MDIVAAILSISALFIMWVVARSFRDPDFDFEKKEYLKSNPESEVLCVHIAWSYPESRIWAELPDNEGIVKLSPTASWQTLEFTISSNLPLRRDSIQILSGPFKPTKCFYSPILRAMVSNEHIASSEIMEFCEEHCIGIEAGSWGALVIKEKGVFKANEIKSIISFVESTLKA